MRELIERLRSLEEADYHTRSGESWPVKANVQEPELLKLALEVWGFKEKSATSVYSLGSSFTVDSAGDGNDKYRKAADKYFRAAKSFNVKARSWQTSLNMWMGGKDPYRDRIKKGFMDTRKRAAVLLKDGHKLAGQSTDLGGYELKDVKNDLGSLIKAIDSALSAL
jgi:hypothetical protein